MDTMKITMLGDSGTGKTTFMMTTYGLMAEDGIQGFSVESNDKTLHKKLMKAFGRFRATGEYPDATVQMESYQYAFYIDDQGVLEFQITDIRGESIRDYDTDELRKALRESDVILLFLNGCDLIMGNDVSDSLFDLYPLINSSIDTSRKRVLIMPVFTQMDRLEELSDNFMDILREPIQPLIDNEKHNDNLLLTMVPTACSRDCLMDLDYAIVSMMYFGYLSKVAEYTKALENELESIQAQYGKGLWRDVIDAFGLDFARDAARARARELKEKYIPYYEKMQERAERIKKFIKDYKIGTSYRLKRTNSYMSEGDIMDW